MKGRVMFVATVASLAACLQARELIAPPVPFAPVGYARGDVKFVKESFVDAVYGRQSVLGERLRYSVGNKSVLNCRDGAGDHLVALKNVVITLDDRIVATFMWWGSIKDSGFGYPFRDLTEDPPAQRLDVSTGVTEFRKKYRLNDGFMHEFIYRLTPMKDSKVLLEWRGDHPVCLWMSLGEQFTRDMKMTIGGKPYLHAVQAEMEPKKGTNRGVDSSYPGGGGTIEMFPAGERSRVTLRFREDAPQSYGVSESMRKDGTVDMIVRAGATKDPRRGSLVIDLNEGAVQARGLPPPTGGIDFWSEDATHVPRKVSRNLLHNPSFEQGMRYWNWMPWGARYAPCTEETIRYWTATGGLHGSRCFIMRDTGWAKEGGGPCNPYSMPVPTEAGKKYTFSFYIRADRPCKARVCLASAARGGQFQAYPMPKRFEWEATTEWRRHEFTFTSDGSGLCVIMSGGGNTRVDCMQLEEGEKATEWTCEPMDGLLLTAKQDNDLVPGEDPTASFEVWGRPGRVVLTVTDMFGRVLAKGAKNVAPPESIPVKLRTEKLGTGVFVMRADFECGDSTSTEYYRFSIIPPLSNKHATKNIFGSLLSHSGVRFTRGRDVARKAMEWGFGSVTWGETRDYMEYNDAQMYKQEREFLVDNMCRALMSEPDFKSKVPGGKDMRSLDSVSPEMEKALEEFAYETVRRNPKHFRHWTLWNEEESTKLGRNPREYVKAQLAVYRGVKRANPDALVSPTHGTSGWSMIRGYSPMKGYLEAAREKGVFYDFISVHPYGNIDGGLIGRLDFEEQTQLLLDLLKEVGYPDTTPIEFTEGFNVPATYVKEWNAGPSYDAYSYGKPTYDWGQRERLHAGSLARYFLNGLRFWPRLGSVNCWISKITIDQHFAPLAAAAAVNTLGHHFPDVSHVATIKTYADVRGFAFRRNTDGRGVAAIWSCNHEVERGRKAGPVFSFVLDGVRAFDIMGNEGDLGRRVGRNLVPLSYTPVILESENPRALADALLAGVAAGATPWGAVSGEDPNKDALRVEASRVEGKAPSYDGVAPAKAYGKSGVKVAWSRENLFVRVEKDRAKTLRVSFDCAANGRDNVRRHGEKAPDDDDYVYTFEPPAGLSSGRCRTTRVKAVYHQLADGVNMASAAEASEKVVAAFAPDGKGGGVFEIVFPLRYIEPVALRSGFMFGMGVDAADEPASWPIVVLGK